MCRCSNALLEHETEEPVFELTTAATAAERAAFEATMAGPWMLEQERIPPHDAERAIRVVWS